MISENTFLPFETGNLDIFENKSVLVLIPHQDDETFGCGGTLQKIKNKAYKIDFCLVTDGSMSSDTVLPETRNRELKKVAENLKVSHLHELGIKDREVFNNLTAIKEQLQKIMKDYDIVFSPNILDMHPDHRYLANIVCDIFAEDKLDKTILFYEVTMQQLLVNYIVDISDVARKKIKNIKYYKSQITLVDYMKNILSLNKLRTLSIPNAKYAEAFYLAEGFEEVLEYKNKIKNLL